MPLTTEQMQDYQKEGFLLFPALIQGARADRANGCLRLLPGSHAYAKLVEYPAGTVVPSSGNMLHGAVTNSSGRSRYSTAWHYLPAEMDLERFRFGIFEDRHLISSQR